MTTVTAPDRVGNRAAVADPAPPAGRVNVADRVFQKVAQQAAADAVGLDGRSVRVEIVAVRDTVLVRVATPFPVPRLDDTAAVRAATPVLQAATAAQSELRTRLTRLFGRPVSRVDITVSGASAPRRKRVH